MNSVVSTSDSPGCWVDFSGGWIFVVNEDDFDAGRSDRFVSIILGLVEVPLSAILYLLESISVELCLFDVDVDVSVVDAFLYREVVRRAMMTSAASPKRQVCPDLAQNRNIT